MNERRTYTNVVGFDDAPFPYEHRGDVLLVGTVCARTRLDGVVTDRVRRDGVNATDRMLASLERSQFAEQIRLVLLQGIAVAGFNVVDVERLHRSFGTPVLVVARRRPRVETFRDALLSIPGGARKWSLIEKLGPMEPLRGIFVQRCGLSLDEADRSLEATTLHGKLPEALRLAHLIAGGVTTGKSRGRA
ncbi:MAG: DUF99 family protein [Polyangiaceae bacterium]|nr:DUF99 family protein [Polyangiaceae bacterium]